MACRFRRAEISWFEPPCIELSSDCIEICRGISIEITCSVQSKCTSHVNEANQRSLGSMWHFLNEMNRGASRSSRPLYEGLPDS